MGVKEKNAVLELILREGRNKQVKRMCQAIGHPVIRLNRPVYGFLRVEGLAPGEWRHLEPPEVELLKKEAAIPSGKRRPPQASREPRAKKAIRRVVVRRSGSKA
jgi:hypothetical protein